MPDQVKPKGRFSYPFTTFTFIGCLVLFLISVPVQRRSAAAREEAKKPDLYLNSVVRALREYRKNRGRWPEKLDVLESEGVWELQAGAEVGAGGRSLQMANYYYRYFVLDGDAVSVWAVPVGDYAYLGSTNFVVVGQKQMRMWKGGPLRHEDAKLVVPYPSDEQFALLMMKEQKLEQAPAKKGGGILSLLSSLLG